MKFTGLILICATSCLALILPAIGVVQFPETPNANTNASPPGFLTTAPSSSNHQTWNTVPTRDAFPANILPPNPSVPIANPPLPFGSNASIGPSANAQPSTASNNKLGMGIWFMLAPICLLGLVMWTLAPNPSGAKPKFSRSYH